MARYYTVYPNRRKAIDAARLKASTEGCSQTVFQPYGSKPGWYIVGPTTDAPDLVASGARPVYSIQAHGRHARPAEPLGHTNAALQAQIAELQAELADAKRMVATERRIRQRVERDRDKRHLALQRANVKLEEHRACQRAVRAITREAIARCEAHGCYGEDV